jgi:hypothetical protein
VLRLVVMRRRRQGDDDGKAGGESGRKTERREGRKRVMVGRRRTGRPGALLGWSLGWADVVGQGQAWFCGRGGANDWSEGLQRLRQWS